MLYSRFWGSALRPRHTKGAMALAGHFWFVRPLVPPLGISIRKTLPRCSLGYNGLCSTSPIAISAHTAEPLRFAAYDDIETVEIHGSSFEINGTCWFKGAKHDLLALQQSLNTVLASKDRSKAVCKTIADEFARGSTAPEQLSARLKTCDLLNFFCSLYAICLLVWFPVVLCRLPTEWLLWRVAFPALLLHLICGALFLRTHKKSAPDQKGARWESFVKMLLCPPMMIRACDVVAGSAPLNGDTSAILIAATKSKQWKPVIQNIWRQASPYLRESLQPEEAQAMLDFSNAYRSALSSALKENGIDPASLEIDASTVSSAENYCPRCGAIFNSLTKTCSDCDGMPLLPGEKK